MAFTFFNESIGPSKVAIPYPVIATTINFKTGSVRTLSHAPRSVNNPLIIPPQDGAKSIIEKATPKLCAQAGNEVESKWCGPAHIYINIKDQKCTIDNRYE